MNTKQPEISVIVPVYKAESYLQECIESILNQDFADFELILVDDGSPDNSGRICDEYAKKDDRIYVIHKENGGTASARNAGLDIMKGKYVSFVDSDDMIHPQALSAFYNNLLNYDADIIKSFPLSFSTIEEICFSELDELKVRELSGRESCFELYDPEGYFFIVCDKLFKAGLFEDIRFPEDIFYEDEAVIYKLLYQSNKVVELNKKLYYYRKQPTSKMHQGFSLKRYDVVKIFMERYWFFLQKGEVELAELSKGIADIYKVKNSLRARSIGQYSNVPKEYRISVPRALQYIKEHCSEQNYEWWLSQVHPILPKLYAYKKKIKSIFLK